jgi:hypothetical protein
MLYKASSAMRKTLACGALATVMLLTPSLGTYVTAVSSAAAQGMGDPSEPLKRNMAAYPEYFAPYSEAAANRERQCRNPQGIPASDWNCRER